MCKKKRVREQISAKSNLTFLRASLFFIYHLFNVLIRRENAAFISPANSSVIREEEGWREGEKRKPKDWRQQREGGVVEVVCSTRIKQTELVPCEKSNRSKKTNNKLTGTIDFFFLHSSVFCSLCFYSKHRNLRGHLRWQAAYAHCPYFFSFFFPSCALWFFSLPQNPTSLPIICFSLYELRFR